MTHGQPCGLNMASMCHNAWKRHACVTHGMPCVNMHGSCEAYIRGLLLAIHTSKGGAARRRRRKGKEKRNGGKERRKGGKEKKMKEEKRRREEKEGGNERSVAQ